MPQSRIDASGNVGSSIGELKALKLQRGRKAALFTRACSTAEAQIARQVGEDELRTGAQELCSSWGGAGSRLATSAQ